MNFTLNLFSGHDMQPDELVSGAPDGHNHEELFHVIDPIETSL